MYMYYAFFTYLQVTLNDILPSLPKLKRINCWSILTIAHTYPVLSSKEKVESNYVNKLRTILRIKNNYLRKQLEGSDTEKNTYAYRCTNMCFAALNTR